MSRTSSRSKTLLRLAAIPALASGLALGSSGCALVAGAGVGYVVSQQVHGNKHVAQVKDDVDRVWAVTKDTLEILVDPGNEVMITDFPRVATVKIDGADVTVEVEAYDIDRTIVRVEAKKYLTSDGMTAENVMQEILDKLERQD